MKWLEKKIKTGSIIPLAAVCGTAVLLSFYKVTTWDVFWHLKVGEVILATGQLITTNLFSSVWPDYPWPNPEWLFQVLLAALHGAAGWKGLTVAKTVVVLLFAVVLYASIRTRGGRPVTAAALAIITLGAAQFRLTERPHLFSYLFMVWTLFVVERHRRRGGRLVWTLPPLFALWSNVHPEMVLGLLCLAGLAAGDVLMRLRGGESERGFDRTLFAAIALCLPAALLNPEHVKALVFPFIHTRLGPVVHLYEYAYPTLAQAPVFWVSLPLAAAVLLLHRRRLDFGDTVITAGAALLGLLYLRGTPYLFIIGAPVIGGLLDGGNAAAEQSAGDTVKRRRDLALVLCAALALTWAAAFDRLMPYRWGWGLDEADYPAAAADLLETGWYPERLYHGYSWGGYLIWRLYPTVGVFQDGRTKAYPPDYLARLNSGFERDDWRFLLDEYGVNTALVTRPEAQALFPKTGWGTVFWDDRWVLLVRRAPDNATFLKRNEYRHFLPESSPPLDDEETLGAWLVEMERNQRERRGRSAVTDSGRGIIYRRLGDTARAENAFRQAIEAESGYGAAWANLGALLLENGRAREASKALAEALRLDPALQGVASLLEQARRQAAAGE